MYKGGGGDLADSTTSLTDETLYQNTISVVISSNISHESQRRPLTVSVSLSSPSNGGRRQIRIRLTDAGDAFFLQNLTLSDEDYNILKHQQGLLVDFSAFPQQLISLLTQCEKSTRFILHFFEGTLSLVELNSFKNLVHLSLQLSPATDAQLKRYLAKCLAMTEAERLSTEQRLNNRISCLETELTNAKCSLESKSHDLDVLRADLEARVSRSEATCAQTVAATRDSALKEKLELQAKYELQRRECENSLRSQLSNAESRIVDLTSSNQELLENKYKSDAHIRQLESRLSILDEETERMRKELLLIRSENSNLQSHVHNNEITIADLRTKLALLEQDKKNLTQKVGGTQDLLDVALKEKTTIYEQAEQNKCRILEVEHQNDKQTEEIEKANSIIRKLQVDLRSALSKLRLKNTVTLKQEKLIQENTSTIDSLTTERDNLSKTASEQKSELEECKQQLKTNENVINWLNKQVNEVQISKRAHTSSSSPLAINTAVDSSKQTSPISTVHSLSVVSLSNATSSSLMPLSSRHEQLSNTTLKSITHYTDSSKYKDPSDPLDSKYLNKSTRRDSSFSSSTPAAGLSNKSNPVLSAYFPNHVINH